MGIENKTKEINTPEQPQQKELSSKQENRTLFAKDLDHNNSISKPEAKTTAQKTDIPNKKAPEKSAATSRDVKPAEVKPPERKVSPPTDIKQERLNQKAALDANRTISVKKPPEGSVTKEKIQSESGEQQESGVDKNAEKTDVTDKNRSDNGDGPKVLYKELDQKPDATDKIEISSKFARENFKAEHSFDAKAKEDYPDLNNLKSKNVYDVKPMGTEISDSERTPKEKYTPEERDRLKEIRDKIDAPDTKTVMQKVIGVASGTDKEAIDSDLARYLNPTDKEGRKSDCQVFGYVAKSEDAAPFTKTPQECHDNLRLDYPDTVYKNPNDSVYVIRFTDGTNYDIPYGEEFGGKHKEAQPFTGDGFLASKDVTIPEFKVRKDENDIGAIVTDGEIYRITPDGKEELVATFNKIDKCFEPYEKKNEEV